MSTAATASPGAPGPPLAAPGDRGGLHHVFRERYLLKLLVRKELRVRYQGSAVGLLWTYVKPAVRFAMYYWVIGLLLPKDLENRALHIFAGMIMVSFFTDAMGAGSRSVVKNKSLVRKINLPREMFPVASVMVSIYHMVPMYVIAFIGCLLVGWSPDPGAFLPALLALAIVLTWGLAVALLLSAWNVYFRDVQNVVDVIQTIITWTVPMIYPFSAVRGALNGWVEQIYLANPLCTAVLLNDRAFWIPTLDAPQQGISAELPPYLLQRGFITLAAGLLLLWFAQVVFSRLEGRFAERL